MKSKKIILLLLVISTLNSFGQCWNKLETGAGFSIATDQYGKLWSAGINNWGQLGNGNSSVSSTRYFNQINSTGTWLMVSAGYNHILAVKSNGTLWAWGSNQMGQLGDGTYTRKYAPTQIGTDTNWAYVSAGTNYSIALKTNGTIWGFGMNNNGLLDSTDSSDKLIPTRIGTDSNWTKIWAGAFHIIAKKSNGSYWAWGANGAGQIGDGTTDTRYTPVQIATGNIWSDFAIGESFTIGLKSNGTIWSWGWNIYGQLGNGNNTDSYVPVQIGADMDWSSIKSGNDYVIAKKSNGSLWAWGNNSNGQLGNNATGTHSNAPQQIGTDLNWDIFSASEYRHVLAYKNNGELWAWGSNSGNYGNGSFSSSDVPVLSTNCTDLGLNANQEKNYSIYPNPVSNQLNIKNPDNNTERIKISDVTGRLVLEQIGGSIINVENLKKGTYFIQFFSHGKVFNDKFIKE